MGFMQQTLYLGRKENREYDFLSDPRRFSSFMEEFRGAHHVLTDGPKNQIDGIHKYQVYHVQPEGVTIRFEHSYLGMADVEFFGTQKNISNLKKRIKKSLA